MSEGRAPGAGTRDAAIRSRADELVATMTPAEKAGQLTQYFWFGFLRETVGPAGDSDQAAGADPPGGGDQAAAAPSDPQPAVDLAMGDQPGMVEAALARGEAGSLLFVTDPAEINRLQRLAIGGNRLGVPVLFGFDVIHGLRTILPVPLALAATWDPATIERAQAVAAREARAVGIHWTFAPMVDIARDPRWGRMVEGAGEDPYLGSAVAAAQVRGFQGEHRQGAPRQGAGGQGADGGHGDGRHGDSGLTGSGLTGSGLTGGGLTGGGQDDRSGDVAPDGVLAGPKHFAGYGAAVGGRDYDEVELSDSQLHNVYLPPFRAALDAGAGAVMTAYMDLNGIPATADRQLSTEVLRGSWGFDGVAVSDANAVRNLVTRGFATDLTDAAARALRAGVDMEMAVTDPAYARLPDALAAGGVDAADLDASVRRVLEAKLRLGLFDDPYVDEDRARAVLSDPASREEARTAAERSAVLLRNEGPLLPLDVSALGSIAVLGPLADSRRDVLGPWVFDHDLDETVTVLAGIRDRVGDAARVRYAPGIRPAQRVYPSMFDMWGDNAPVDPEDFDDDAELRRAVELARDADVAVLVAGEWQNMIGEAASRSSLELPGRQLELLQAVVATGTPVVLLVLNGRPLDLRWAAANVPAILDLWYPGTRGGTAAANLLFGDVSPGGKLPFTWPRTVGQVPITYSHTLSHEPDNQGRRYWDEASTPLFPFGHGLAYASFGYDRIGVDRETVGAEETVTVSVEVSNTGSRTADEVVQLYLHQRSGSASRPVRELKGFQRVTVAAGQSRTLSFPVGPAERRYWNAAVRDWVLDRSTFDVWVGGDSTATLTTTFDVTAAPAEG